MSTMHVNIVRVDDAFHFQATGTAGVAVSMDSSPETGGHNLGARPMEMLLMGLGGCTGIDVLLILKKQRQTVTDFRIEVKGEREKIEGTEMTPFRKIHLHYTLSGYVQAEKVARAIQLSMEKYCSATAQLAPTAEITSSFEIM